MARSLARYPVTKKFCILFSLLSNIKILLFNFPCYPSWPKFYAVFVEYLAFFAELSLDTGVPRTWTRRKTPSILGKLHRILARTGISHCSISQEHLSRDDRRLRVKILWIYDQRICTVFFFLSSLLRRDFSTIQIMVIGDRSIITHQKQIDHHYDSDSRAYVECQKIVSVND